MTIRLGLTSAEAKSRHQQGLGNDVELTTSRSLADILRANFLNIANVILLAIVAVLVALGEVGDAFTTGGVVIVNVLVGTFQEYRSKRKLDQIALLTRPKVTLIRDGQPTQVDQSEVVVGDAILLKSGDQAVVDGSMVADPDAEGKSPRLDMDESLLTGESDLIAKRPGDEILSGSFAVVGEGYFIAEKVGNDSFAQKITSGARQYTRVVTPLQRELSIIVRVLVVAAIVLSALLFLGRGFRGEPFDEGVEDTAVVLSLVPQGLLLLITVAYALGSVRLAGRGALVQQSNAVESLSHVDVLCLDKTGTLTTNRILFHALHPLDGTSEAEMRQSLGDYIASTGSRNRTAEAVAEAITGTVRTVVTEIPFSSARKWSAASFADSGTYILGAPEMLGFGDGLPSEITALAQQGMRVLMFAHSEHVLQPDEFPDGSEPDLPPNVTTLGLISFTDELRPAVQDVLAGFRKANITLKLISGDNPETVASLAYQAGFSPEHDRTISGMELAEMPEFAFAKAVRDHAIFGRITPEQKQAIVDVLRADGHYVAMMGDGVNDVLSLKKAQVGIAMEDGSQATRGVADIVLLGNKFEALPHAFLEGQRILNGMNDTARLFLTRTLYTALLVIVAGFIGSAFPFSPRHNALLTTLPLGIPSFFLTYWARTGQPKKGLLTSVAEFVFPAGISLTIMLTAIWVYFLTTRDASVIEARSVLTLTGVFGGLLVIILAEKDREVWRNGSLQFRDYRRMALTLVMLAGVVVVMLVPGLRDFFEIVNHSAQEFAISIGALAVWLVVLVMLWRYDVLERLLIPNYREPSPPDSPQKQDL
jgi:cation-transporting ATPase E